MADFGSVFPPRPAPRTRTSLTLQVPGSASASPEDGSTLGNPIVLDPSEYTARPGDAHRHAEFHAGPWQQGGYSYNDYAHIGDYNPDQQPQQQQPESVPQEPVISPSLPNALSRPLYKDEQEKLAQLDKLKFFLATAPSHWDKSRIESDTFPPEDDLGLNMSSFPDLAGSATSVPPQGSHPALNRFLLPGGEYVTCVLWNGLYHISGTDIVRALVFRFEAFGRPVTNHKKFEEGVFSDLRNLKPGVDASLEDPKSPFLDLLFKWQCIRTQKKQKVFYWFSVPHDRLFLDALERDLKREKVGHEPTTKVHGEPANSFSYDSRRSLYEQFITRPGKDDASEKDESAAENEQNSEDATGENVQGGKRPATVSPFLSMFNLFEGSPTYKQRRKKGIGKSMLSRKDSEPADEHRGRSGARGTPQWSYNESISRERGSETEDFSTASSTSGPSTGEAISAGPTAADMFTMQAKGEFGPPKKAPKPDHSQAYAPPEVEIWNGSDVPSVMSAGPGVGMGMNHFGAARMNLPYGQGDSTSYSDKRRSYEGPNPSRDPYMNMNAYGGALSANFATSSFAQAHARNVALQQGQGFDQMMAVGANATEPKSGESSASPAQYPNPFTNDPRSLQHVDTVTTTTRAFVCPLFSCRRLFKRMEHLKRHLRTHTLERPYACPKCRKKFSRSDNLGQHLKTHEKNDELSSDAIAATRAAGVGVRSPANGEEGDVEDAGEEPMEDIDFTQDEPMPQHNSIGINAELGLFGGMGAGMGMAGGVNNLGGIAGASAEQEQSQAPIDMHLCEVEVQGEVREVQGDEEGLLMSGAGQQVQYTNPGARQQQQQQQSDFGTSEWMRPHHMSSPAMSGGNVSSPPSNSIPLGRKQQSNHSSLAGSPSMGPGMQYLPRTSSPLHHAPHARPIPQSLSNGPSAPGSVSSSYNDEYLNMAMSNSAPSHKLHFDHASLYPPGLMMESAQGGPVRRHRSMTPSINRHGADIRRPQTSSSGSFDGAERGYHPYAYNGSSSRAGSVAGSTHSSPATNNNNLPLAPGPGPEYAQAAYRNANNSNSGGHSRRSSFGNSGLPDQMRQMMSLNNGSSASLNSSPGDVFAPSGTNMFRTDSPSSFHNHTQSPAHFSTDLPTSNQAVPFDFGAGHQPHHAATIPQHQGPYNQAGIFASPNAAMMASSSDGLGEYVAHDGAFFAHQPHMTI